MADQQGFDMTTEVDVCYQFTLTELEDFVRKGQLPHSLSKAGREFFRDLDTFIEEVKDALTSANAKLEMLREVLDE